MLSDGAAVYTPGVSQRRGGATTHDLPDRLGTSIRQTNVWSNTLATRTYDAFGTLQATTGAPVGPFGFAGGHGYQEDGDSGLKLLGHRYYDPSTGRFLTRDPIQDGRNWYAYVDGNPLRAVDPDGLRVIFGGLGGQLIGVLFSFSFHVDVAYDPDSGHVGIGVTAGFGPAVGIGVSGGPEFGVDPTTSVGGGGPKPLSGWANGLATPVATLEAYDTTEGWMPGPNTGLPPPQLPGPNLGVAPGLAPALGVYREKRAGTMYSLW